jgi:hypothetical protein
MSNALFRSTTRIESCDALGVISHQVSCPFLADWMASGLDRIIRFLNAE